MNVRNMPWLGRSISVISSSDPTLVGNSGLIIDETMRTIKIQQGGQQLTMAKNVIRFTIDEEQDVIDGSLVKQRPEDRIHRRYRK
ncbi:MAG: ribonuclease P protein subunit [Candidatus Poseidoniaceae archaeon]|mgnify:FL=1|nr:ribonuclease P protein subunit [Candidatus Poseidoniaceae archaeon]|tara:strand:+ start:788 stop:1042 length:255 start_codon:yes stop_codon:yes gene_type:complete